MNLPDDTVAQLLKGALRQPALSQQSLERLRAAVENERRARLLHSRRVRTGRWAGLLAACLCAVVVLTWWAFGQSSAVIGSVDQGLASGIVVTRSGLLARATPGQTTLRVGQSVDARANAAIRLSHGGSLRMKAGSSVTFVSAGEIELRRGAIYLDIDPAHARVTLAIRTPFGLVQHLGTQYEVALLPAQLRLRVREGKVQVQGTVAARAQAGEELTISSTQALQRRAIAPYGDAWAWEESVAGDFEAEGRNVGQLLQWVARETGRRIHFADEHVDQLASQTVLHGSIRGLPPDVALRAILATTTLAADVRDEFITVHAEAPTAAPRP
jgi:ferric-dicitrate binding protein FerR (iron transport regulator)